MWKCMPTLQRMSYMRPAVCRLMLFLGEPAASWNKIQVTQHADTFMAAGKVSSAKTSSGCKKTSAASENARSHWCDWEARAAAAEAELFLQTFSQSYQAGDNQRAERVEWVRRSTLGPRTAWLLLQWRHLSHTSLCAKRQNPVRWRKGHRARCVIIFLVSFTTGGCCVNMVPWYWRGQSRDTTNSFSCDFKFCNFNQFLKTDQLTTQLSVENVFLFVF